MKLFTHLLFIIISLLLVSTVSSNPAQWSRYIKTQSQDEVTISFRQKLKGQAWLIEWHVKNNSDNKVEPIMLSRQYFCKNGESVELNQQSLGVYLPKSNRKGDIKDLGICPKSKIEFIEIKTEILKLPIDQMTTVSSP